MAKKILLFAPMTFNLAETTRMIEIAKGIAHHDTAGKMFDIQFMSDGGEFEGLIEEQHFPLHRMEPRLTPEKIEHLLKVDKAEKIAPSFSVQEISERIENELAYVKQLKPVAVITGFYMTIPLTCRIAHIPLVWVVQSTWLPDFFAHGAGMTDRLTFKPVKWIADRAILLLINLFVRYSLLGSLNKVAKRFGVPGYKSMFDYQRGDETLVAEPAEFSSVKLPPHYYFTGPLIARQDFPLPVEITQLPHDQPLIYFAMGSSGTPEIVAHIIESFEGKPYRVIAPVKFQLDKVPGVKIPSNVMVTDWLPALEVNRLADLSVIHGGIGTVMTAAYAGKPVVGIGMQPEQDANIACLVRKGFALRVPKSKDPSRRVQEAIQALLDNEEAKRRAEAFARIMEQWDGPQMAAELLLEKFGNHA